MSERSGFQVSDRAAELYEQYPARYLLGPWAPRLVALASLQSGERVLDLACGTGVVARLAASKVEPGHVTGLDINAGMARCRPLPFDLAWTCHHLGRSERCCHGLAGRLF
jgi:SAM-dependent methyltransferase